MVWLSHDRGSCSWDVDQAGWVVRLHSPDEQDSYGTTLEDALAWCLVWLMASELERRSQEVTRQMVAAVGKAAAGIGGSDGLEGRTGGGDQTWEGALRRATQALLDRGAGQLNGVAVG